MSMETSSAKIKKKQPVNIEHKGLEKNKLEMFLALPVALVVSIVPIVVGVYVRELQPELATLWFKKIEIDIYSHHSAITTILFGVIMLIITFFVLKKAMLPKDKETKLILKLLGLYSILAVVSTFWALNRDVAIWGAPDRFEGVLVHLSYMIIVFYATLILRGKNTRKYITAAVLCLACVESIIGIAAMMGKDLVLDGPVFSFLLSSLPEGVAKADVGLSVTTATASSGLNSLTIGNSNFVGSYAVLMIPVLTSLVFDKNNKKNIRILSALLTLTTVGILIFSRSEAGVVGIVMAFITAVILVISLPNYNINKRKIAAFAIGALIAFPVIGYQMIPDTNKPQILRIATEAKQLFSKLDVEYDPNYGLGMYEFKINGNEMLVSTKEGLIKFVGDKEGNLDVYDEGGNLIAVHFNDDKKRYELEAPYNKVYYLFSTFDEPVDDLNGIFLGYEDLDAKSNFILIEQNFEEGFFIVNPKFDRIELVHAPHYGFEGKESLGTNRGYIWSRSIPLLKNTIIKGYGPDNYLLAFPQQDYWAKSGALKSPQPHLTVDKPHNMYLQWAINNGVLALVSLLGVFGIYIFTQIKNLRKYGLNDPNKVFKIGILCSVIGYLATGMFNDSVVSVAPIFWSLLGVGIAGMTEGMSQGLEKK